MPAADSLTAKRLPEKQTALESVFQVAFALIACRLGLGYPAGY